MSTRKVEVRLFAAARDAVGRERVPARVPLDGTVADLLRHLEDAHPAAAPVLRTCRVAVDLEFAAPGDEIPEGAEVALVPPVSGG